MVGLPCYRGAVTSQTAMALSGTLILLKDLGIGCEVSLVDSTEIAVARNMIATAAWRDPAVTHLLFIDDDMAFEPEAAVALLRRDKAIIGCVCPERRIDLVRLHAEAAEGKSFETALAAAQPFVVRFSKGDKVEVKDGLCPMAGIGMALTLIQRRVLDSLVSGGHVQRWDVRAGADHLGNTFHYGFFDRIPNEHDNALLSEDYSFCERWRRFCQGEIFALTDQTIGHVGQMVYTGRWQDRLATGNV